MEFIRFVFGLLMLAIGAAFFILAIGDFVSFLFYSELKSIVMFVCHVLLSSPFLYLVLGKTG